MRFPVQIAFKVLALAPQMYVTDADGRSLGYVRQKLLRLVEDVTIFADDTQQKEIYSIKADRVIDFSANYHFADAQGRPIGSVARHGVRSLWRAHYVVNVGDEPRLEVSEERPFIRLLDGLIGEIPLVGMLTGLFLNPSYLVSRSGGGEVMRITKRRALFETDFRIDKLGDTDDKEQECALLAAMMIMLLERSRG